MKKFFVISILLATLLQLAAVLSPAFADAYAAHVFPVWTATLGRLTSLFSFSVGEIMLVAALILILTFIAVCIAHLTLRLKKGRGFQLPRLFECFYTFCLVIVGIFFPVMVLNCFLLYRCTPLSETFRAQPGTAQADSSGGDGSQSAPGIAELTALRNECVSSCNTLAASLPRDEEGRLRLPEKSTFLASAKETVADAATAFPRLRGFQVTPKPLAFSAFVSQQLMTGYYFPFSMEATYNNLMEPVHLPFTLCHELAHTHGYLREDECNFLAWVCCTASDDPVFQYSGWLNVLWYIDRDFKTAVGTDAYEAALVIDDIVRRDSQFLSPTVRAQIEEDALFKTETVEQATRTYVDTTLRVNGIDAGYESYAEVVRLILLYGRTDP